MPGGGSGLALRPQAASKTVNAPASARRRGNMARAGAGRAPGSAPSSGRRRAGCAAEDGAESRCMRFGGAVILVLGLCLPGAADVGASGAASPGLPQFIPTTPPRPVPEVTVETRTGERVRLPDLKGHPLLINFWATWCGPCVSEMPALEALAAERAGTPLMIMAVSEDR